MKKRTIYLPEWLDELVEQKAKRQRRSFSAQVLWESEWSVGPPTPYFNSDREGNIVKPIAWAEPRIKMWEEGGFEYDD